MCQARSKGQYKETISHENWTKRSISKQKGTSLELVVPIVPTVVAAIQAQKYCMSKQLLASHTLDPALPWLFHFFKLILFLQDAAPSTLSAIFFVRNHRGGLLASLNKTQVFVYLCYFLQILRFTCTIVPCNVEACGPEMRLFFSSAEPLELFLRFLLLPRKCLNIRNNLYRPDSKLTFEEKAGSIKTRFFTRNFSFCLFSF